jgi:hypothetical protein
MEYVMVGHAYSSLHPERVLIAGLFRDYAITSQYASNSPPSGSFIPGRVFFDRQSVVAVT